MKTSYSGTATSGASKDLAPEHAGRVSFFFKSLGDVFVVRFDGSNATSDPKVGSCVQVKANESLFLTNNDPYDIRKKITVYCASASDFVCQAEQ